MSGNLTGIFDQSSAPEVENNYELLPPGDYEGEIARAELKDTKSGGQMIRLDIVLDNGRHVFDNLNIVCRNETAQKIAQANLKRIAETNNRQVKDTDDLLQCRVKVKVGVRPAQGEYDAQNTVKFYQELKARNGASAGNDGSTPAARPAASRPAARAATPSGGNPWMKPAATQKTVNEELDDKVPF